jgi:hypothetical protein
MRKLFIISLLFFFCACGSQPISPWKDTAFHQLESYKMNFLNDKEDATEPHFVQAKKAISSNNDLSLLAVLYLTKYALQTAALEDFDESDFIRIDRLQSNTANRAYFDLLKGNFAGVQAAALPPDYSKLLPLMTSKNSLAPTREIASITNPLTRLIACGIWVKYLPYDESLLQLAIDTAADKGWRRPLWAYLNRLQQYYHNRQETAKSLSIKERLELLQK